MSTTPSTATGWFPEHTHTALPPGATQPQQANAQAGLGQAMFFDGSGNVALNDGATPGLVCAGVVVQRLSTTSTVAGAEAAQLHTGYGGGQPASTAANDGFTASDVLTPAFDSGNGVPGKLSNLSGNNRSFLGVVLGLIDGITPRVWAGPIASAFARMLHLLVSEIGGGYGFADAAANTATTEVAMSRKPVHGVVTAVQFIGAAVVADNTDYDQLTVYKRDLNGATQVSIATYDTRAAHEGAITAFKPASFTLSVVAGALNLLETDVLTIAAVKNGAGKTLTGTVRVVQKVI